MKILLLEDEIMLQNSIEEYLTTLGHICYSFSNGTDAKNALKNEIYDILIFDINVPSLNGLELFEYLKQNNFNIPVVFISALSDIENITKAFNLGAADYIKKPFHLKELALRVQKISKEIENKTRNHILLSEHYSYLKNENRLFFNDGAVNLTKKQSAIIKCLCNNIGMILNFDMFREYVWNDAFVSDATIRTEISRLRKNLKDDFIQNYKGLGYKVDRYVKLVS